MGNDSPTPDFLKRWAEDPANRTTIFEWACFDQVSMCFFLSGLPPQEQLVIFGLQHTVPDGPTVTLAEALTKTEAGRRVLSQFMVDNSGLAPGFSEDWRPNTIGRYWWP